MAWRKSPASLIDIFDRLMPEDPKIERRKMFGYPAAFTNGNLFAGLHQESFILRLSEADREVFQAKYQAAIFEPMAGRKMREYVVVPSDLLGDKRAMDHWLSRSRDYAAGVARKTPAKQRQNAKR
jgi:TfoX/Sxy family transcriptional regulator of competence genes